jgi:hypothetical protein
MFKTHRSRDGIVQPIASMENSHLLNYIRMMMSKVGEVNAALRLLDEPSTSRGRFQSALYGMREVTPEDAASEIRNIIDALTPYLLEAYLRNMPEPREMLAEAIGRSETMKIFIPQLPQLPGSYVADDDEKCPF